MDTHTADFHCTVHDARAIGADLLKQTRYVRGRSVNRPVYIRVNGTILHEGSEAECNCSTLFDILGKAEIERSIAAAKLGEQYIFEDDEEGHETDIEAEALPPVPAQNSKELSATAQ